MKDSCYTLKELDLQLLFMIHLRMIQCGDDQASRILTKSSLLKLLETSPDYVHQYDEQYWSDFVYKEYEEKKEQEKAKAKDIEHSIISLLDQNKSLDEIHQLLLIPVEVINAVFEKYLLLKNDAEYFKKYLCERIEEYGTIILLSDVEDIRKTMRKVIKEDPLAAAV